LPYNNKIHLAIKVSPFKANYGQDPRIWFKGKTKEKYEATGRFVEQMRKIQEEAKVVLEKVQDVKLNIYCTMYYYSLIYELCLHKHTCFFVSTAMS